MRLDFSPYQLKPKQIYKNIYFSTSGILLRIEKNGEVFYSLYHPIVALGDPLVSEVVQKIKEKQWSDPLLQRILGFKVSLDSIGTPASFEVPCYASCPGLDFFKEQAKEILEHQFSVVKIKISSLKILEDHLDFLKEVPLNYILDFNAQESAENFSNLSSKAKAFLQERVDYVEDPFRELREVKFALASDFMDYKGLEDYKILKPSGFCHPLDLESQATKVVTSYLDHPLGQLASALWVLKREIKTLSGLYSHTYFENNIYSEILGGQGCSLDVRCLDEVGALLKKENWSRLV